jgi:titin
VAGARNVVSGNRADGIACFGFTEVAGNYVGLNAAGTGAVPNRNGVGAYTQSFIGLTAPSRSPAGNVISGNTDAGVRISGEFSGLVEVDANLIGTNPAGTAAVPNGDGLVIADGGATAFVGFTARNVISGNDFAGVLIRDPGFGHNRLYDNFIGLNRAGTAAVPNGTGVEIAAGAVDNSIGDPVRPERNVIAGNRFEGIRIHGTGTQRNQVARALVGLRRTGEALGNGRGIVVANGAEGNTIGGASAAAANTISANRSDGVLITGAGTQRNVVRGNRIGTSPDGTAARSNLVGVNVADGARFNTVGGPAGAPPSQISGNRSAGVRVAGAETLGNRVQGNLIGTGATGTTALPNAAGVVVSGGAQATTVGGAGSLANRIGFNTGSGVLIEGAGTTGAELVRNAIFGSGQLPINLRPPAEAPDVVTLNDLDDADTGPNELQNFPVITAAAGSPGTTTISGTLNSRPSLNHRVEVFRNPVASADPEAGTFVGVATATTNAGGDATWSLTVPSDLSGQLLRATALATRSTSELSAARSVD